MKLEDYSKEERKFDKLIAVTTVAYGFELWMLTRKEISCEKN
jgi:hypothetical protein